MEPEPTEPTDLCGVEVKSGDGMLPENGVGDVQHFPNSTHTWPAKQELRVVALSLLPESYVASVM